MLGHQDFQMSCRLRILHFVATCAAALSATTSVISAADAQADYAALRKLSETQSLPNVARDSDAHREWWMQRFRTLHDRGLDFIATYATHPLRWDVLVLMRYGRDYHIVVRADGSKAVMPRQLETALWEQKYYAMLTGLLESSDASSAARQQALVQLIDYHCTAVRSGTVDHPKQGIVPALMDWTKELHALDPRSGRLAYLYLRVAHMLNALDPAQCRVFLAEKQALHSSMERPDTEVRRHVENFLRLMRNQDEPAAELWKQLQQFDPRLADLSVYRGKVVLIAYLTVDWTSHTIELERLHREYHDAGLEIIHVAYYNSSSSPLLQRDKAAVERYVAEKGWPWRVLWQPKGYPDDFYSYWGLNTVPAYLVVGRDGRLAREVPGELKWDVRLNRELRKPVPAL